MAGFMTDIILGMGEVGSTIFALLKSRGYACVGIDSDDGRSRNYVEGCSVSDPDILHVCIPGDLMGFESVVLGCVESNGGIRAILVHSTVRPGTAVSLQNKTNIPVVSSPARGVHQRFLEDMVRYTKFLATNRPLSSGLRDDIERRFKKVQWMSDTKTLEFAKLLTDTTYYGWLINYAQLTKTICDSEEIDYDEMWTFADEIHEFLGNRPKMHPGVIGGHCVIPNLSLIDHHTLWRIRAINDEFKAAKDRTD